MAQLGITARSLGGGIRIWMLAILLLLAAPFAAQAEDCSDYPNGLLDGFAGTVAPSQLQIDRNCTVRNYPASNPMSTNFSFFTNPGQNNDRWLMIFDDFPIVPAGRQIIVELTGILDNSPTNAPGTQFVNTAKWDFDTFEVETQ